MIHAVTAALRTATATPTPTPPPGFDPNSVTPTWVGFAATFLVAAAVVFLIMDMVRRVRRVRYRGEIREQLEAEQRGAEQRGADREAADAPPEADDVTPRAGD